MRYHNNVKTIVIPAGGSITVDYGPETNYNVSENIALWLEGGAVTYTVNYNTVATSNTGSYAGGVAKKIFTEAGPIAISSTYPSVTLAGVAGVAVNVSWLGLIRQVNG